MPGSARFKTLTSLGRRLRCTSLIVVLDLSDFFRTLFNVKLNLIN
jgi:hypothetical protein